YAVRPSPGNACPAPPPSSVCGSALRPDQEHEPDSGRLAIGEQESVTQVYERYLRIADLPQEMILLVLDQEFLNAVDDVGGRVLASVLHVEHLLQLRGRHEKYHLALLGIDAIPSAVGHLARALIAANDRQPAHGVLEVIACLIYLIFRDIGPVVILEL